MGSDGAACSRPQTIVADRRARILDAMIEVVGERGFRSSSVALVAARARVSNSTFYECFDGLDDCLTAVIDLGLERVGGLTMAAFVKEDSWPEGIRAALASLLVFFDSEPVLTRVWFIESMAAGAWALERRERNLAMLRGMIVEHWSIPGYDAPKPLAITGIMASVLGVIQAHLVMKKPQPLITLLGPLMGLITAPYLDAAGVAREIEQGEQHTHALLAERYPPPPQHTTEGAGAGAGAGAGTGARRPEEARIPRGQRARSCVLYIAEQRARGTGPSNREIAAAIGIAHPGQASALLIRLANEGLLTKHAGGPGHPNAWGLTARGRRVAKALKAGGG